MIKYIKYLYNHIEIFNLKSCFGIELYIISKHIQRYILLEHNENV